MMFYPLRFRGIGRFGWRTPRRCVEPSTCFRNCDLKLRLGNDGRHHRANYGKPRSLEAKHAAVSLVVLAHSTIHCPIPEGIVPGKSLQMANKIVDDVILKLIDVQEVFLRLPPAQASYSITSSTTMTTCCSPPVVCYLPCVVLVPNLHFCPVDTFLIVRNVQL